jgi:hypothetical protein
MTARNRRVLGLFIIMFGLALYCILVMKLAVLILPIHWIVDLLFYAAAGILWIFPAAWVMRKTGA